MNTKNQYRNYFSLVKNENENGSMNKPKKMRRLGYGRKGWIKNRREDVEGDAG